MPDHLIDAKQLRVFFPVKEGLFSSTKDFVKAVDGVTLQIRKGETFGLAGESGCGKTTLGRALIHLVPPTEGTLVVLGSNLSEISKGQLRRLRPSMQIVFQDPSSSLNPRMTVKQILSEPLRLNKKMTGEQATARVLELLKTVGLDEQHLYRFPHEFSGGQKQRIGIARALALNPDFVVLDEPTSALDVSVQAQILNLLKDLQAQYNLTYLLITHDLSVIKFLSDRVAIMYAGKIVEYANTVDLFRQPIHPYTQALLSAIPIPDPSQRSKHHHLKGEVPSLIKPPSGCRFHPRCTVANKACRTVEPHMKEVSKDHFVACF